MNKAVYLKEVQEIETGYKAKGFVWDGECYCTAKLFEVTIKTADELFEYEIKNFLRKADFSSGDNLDFVRL